MGKYGASLIHEWWSDWHYTNKKIKRKAWMSDVDVIVTKNGVRKRTWVEMRDDGIIAVLELKWKWAVELGLEVITVTESVLMKFFERNNRPFYIVVVDPRTRRPTFDIYRPHKQESNQGKYEPFAIFSEDDMIEWINADYDLDFLSKKARVTITTRSKVEELM